MVRKTILSVTFMLHSSRFPCFQTSTVDVFIFHWERFGHFLSIAHFQNKFSVHYTYKNTCWCISQATRSYSGYQDIHRNKTAHISQCLCCRNTEACAPCKVLLFLVGSILGPGTDCLQKRGEQWRKYQPKVSLFSCDVDKNKRTINHFILTIIILTCLFACLLVFFVCLFVSSRYIESVINHGDIACHPCTAQWLIGHVGAFNYRSFEHLTFSTTKITKQNRLQ